MINIKNTNIILIILLILINNFNEIDCVTKYFDSHSGRWSDGANWRGGVLPTTTDNVIISKSTDQTCFSTNSVIEAYAVFVGNSTTLGVDLQIQNYGLQFYQLTINYGSHGYIGIKNNPLVYGPDYFINATVFDVKGDLDIQYYFNANSSYSKVNTTVQITGDGQLLIDSSEFECYMINNLAGGKTFIQNQSNVKLLGLRGDSSTIRVRESSLFIKNNPNGQSTSLYNKTIANIIDSKFTIYDVLNLLDGSKLYFIGSNVSFYDESILLFDTAGVYVSNASMYIVEGAHYYCEKFISNRDSITVFDSSTGLFNNDYYLYGASELRVVNSTIQMNHTVLSTEDSFISFSSDSKILTYGTVVVNDTAIMVGSNAEFSVKSKKDLGSNKTLFFQVRDNAKLVFTENSIVSIEANLTLGENAMFLINSCLVSLNSRAFFIDESYLQITNSTSMILDDNLYMVDDSHMYVLDSDLTIRGSVVFNNNAFLTARQSTVTINGYFSDYTNPFKEFFLAILNSSFKVNGFFYSSGNIKLDNSTLECNKELIIDGGFIADNQTKIIVSNGNFTIDGYVRITNSSVILVNGILEFKTNSSTTFINSEIRLENGNLKINENSTISLLNTILYNDNAAVNINGDIYINTNSSMKNSANFILNSNILPINNTGLEFFINSGGNLEINALYNSTSNITNIFVPLLNNNGTINFVTNQINLLSFISTSGGLLILNQNSINSNSTIQLLESNLIGSGIINTSISSNGSVVGNNSITNLSVIGDLESTNDEFIFTINGEANGKGNLNSTLITVSNNTIINNSTIVIRVSIDLINLKQNTTLITSGSDIVGNGFNKVIFKSYDPSTGVERELEECAHNIEIKKGTLGVLFNNNIEKCIVTSSSEIIVVVEETNNSISKSLGAGAVAGIIIGVVAAVVTVGAVIHFRNKIPKVDRLSFKLKQFSKGQAN